MSNFVIVNGELTQYTGTESTILIPEEVTVIGQGAFTASKATRIQLPKKLKKIKAMAFQRCDYLTQLDIPDTVTTIEKNAFAFSGIESVKLPAKIKVIKESTFYGTKLKQITIPEGVKKIESEAFGGCQNLEKVVLPKSLETIAAGAFKNCETLRSINLAPGVAVAGKVFDFCVGLADAQGFIIVNGGLYKSPALYQNYHVVLPEGVKIIKSQSIDIRRNVQDVMYVTSREEHRNALNNKVGSVIEIPASVEVIESTAFLGDVTEIISHSKAGFPALACHSCTKLKKLTVPKGTVVDKALFAFGPDGEAMLSKLNIVYV